MRAPAVVLLLAAACGGTEPTVPSDAVKVPFESLNALFGTARLPSLWTEGRARFAVRDQAVWATVHQRVTGVGTAPAIDFSDRAVIFAAMGSRLSTGYDIVIDEVRKDPAGRLYIMVREIAPGSGCNILASPTSPVTAVRTINAYSTLVFVERTETDRCTVS